MQDRGFAGPSIGPLAWMHITDLGSINLGFADGEETGPLFADMPLHFADDRHVPCRMRVWGLGAALAGRLSKR